MAEVCCNREWDSKCLCLKEGDRLEYQGAQALRYKKWKKDVWLKKGVKGKIIKINEGSPPRPDVITEDFPEGLPSIDAWATFQLNGDENAKTAVSLRNIKDYKKLENGRPT